MPHRPSDPMDDDDDDLPSPPLLKLLCSFGGTVLPRPLDHRLRYVGGETRILRVPRRVSLRALLALARSLFPLARALKYQPPGEDLDALVSLVDDDDVSSMIHELDRAPSLGPARLRLFAFPRPPLDRLFPPPPPLNEREIERRYVDAVNSVADEWCPADFGFLQRGDRGELPLPPSSWDVSGDEFARWTPGYDGHRTTGGMAAEGGFPCDLATVCEPCRMRLQKIGGSSVELGFLFSNLCAQCQCNVDKRFRSLHGGGDDRIDHGDARMQLDAQITANGNRMNLCFEHGDAAFYRQPVSCSCASYGSGSSVHFGAELGNGAYCCHEHSRSQGSNALAYGVDSVYHMPYGAGSIHPLVEPMQGALGYGSFCERAPHILQTNLAVSFNYNQPLRVVSPGHPQFGSEQQFLNPQVGFTGSPPLSTDGSGFHVSQHVGCPGSYADMVNLVALQSFSLDCANYQQAGDLDYGPEGPVRSSSSTLSGVTSTPVLVPQSSAQLEHSDEITFHVGACDSREQETTEELHDSRKLYQKKEEDGGIRLEGSELVSLCGGIHMLSKADAACQYENGKQFSSELATALNKMRLDQVASNVNVTDDSSKEKAPSHCSETQNSEVRSSLELAIVPTIEPTEAEAEAIEKGLQTIKNGDLEEIGKLGTGAFGAVYHGKWKGCDVAIKRIKASCFSGKPSERERMIADFWKEALILSSLHHPNVISFYGVVRDALDGNLATVTEFMVNGSLKNFLQKKDRSVDFKKRLIIAMDVACGMEYLHERNIVHFDLKCENLLVNMRDPHRPICKIGDLGLCKVKQHTFVSGGLRGTLPWMAPELLSGKTKNVSEKVDVYSFGIVLWELLTCEEPYAEMDYASVIGGIVKGTLRPEVPGWCHDGYQSLMESCWATDPSERPSFSEISQQLRKLAESINKELIKKNPPR